MFDQQSSRLLQGAPPAAGIIPEDLPRILTEIYTELVTDRVRGINADRLTESVQRLTSIGNTYELLTMLSPDAAERRAAAFVATSAYQILAKSLQDINGEDTVSFTRDHINGNIAAALLFLIAGQYADAREAIRPFRSAGGNPPLLLQMLAETLTDLVLENFGAIQARGDRRRQITSNQEAEPMQRATLHLYTLILQGIEVLEVINVHRRTRYHDLFS